MEKMIRRFVNLLFFIGFTFGDERSQSKLEYEAGNALFVNKKYADALSHYHKAIELDPTNYQAIFRRATTYFTFGRTKPGLVDLDTVLDQKPDFTGARQQRANVLLKLGRLDDAVLDLNVLLKSGIISTLEIEEKLELIEQNMNELNILNQHHSGMNCETVDEITTKLLESQPWDASLFIKRAKCHQSENRLKAAIHDFKHASKLSSDNTDLLYDMSVLEYEVGDIRDSLSTIRDCLKLNPDHKKCYSSYKSLRKVVKALDSMKSSIEQQQWTICLETGGKLLKWNDNVSVKINVYRLTAQCNREEGNIGAAIEECNQILEFDESDVDTWIDRAETYLIDEEYDLSIADYEKALELDSSNEAAKSGKEQAKRAKELVGKRDYYKILGVRRNANKREITKAYRKMAQKWHPDNFQDEKEKKRAEKKFIDIAAAKEVLSDEEKRRTFDNGQDPLDPEKGHDHHGGGFHGFQGFNPFGRGGGGGNRGDFFFHF